MNPSQCSPEDPSGDLQAELERIATPNPDPCQCPNCRLRRAIRGMLALAEERVACEQDSPTVSDLGGGPAKPAAGAEPPAAAFYDICQFCGSHSVPRKALPVLTGPAFDWPEGEDFRLACRQAVLARRRTVGAGPYPGDGVLEPLDRACAILARLDERPVPPADLKWKPAP